MSSAKERKPLGRGIRSLIPEVESGDLARVIEIDVNLIDPNPMQPRKKFDLESLEDLKLSILEVGVITPIIVQKIGERYQLIAGERRLSASKLADKPTIPCIVRECDSEELLKLALIENLQREDLNDIELAEAYQKLRDEFYLTQNQIATKVGKSRSVIANTLRLLELSQNLQEAVRTGEITSGHARALLSLDEEKRERVLEIIRKKSLSVREVEALAQHGALQLNGNGNSHESTDLETDFTRSRTTASLDADTLNLLKSIEEKLRTKIEVKPSGRNNPGGKLVIHYYGDEDFGHILTLLAQIRNAQPLEKLKIGKPSEADGAPDIPLDE